MIIAIEGNIGAGKTTLSYEFKNKAWQVLEEPVNQWTINGNNMLDAYYANPKKMAYLFQQVTLSTKTKELLSLHAADWCLDRSLAADLLFASIQHDNGYFSDLQMDVYKETYKVCESVTPDVDYYIYLKTPVEICLERIKRRNRTCEQNISKEYLEQLEAKHDAWLLPKDNVLVLDGSKSIYDTKLRAELLQTIETFLSKTGRQYKTLV